MVHKKKTLSVLVAMALTSGLLLAQDRDRDRARDPVTRQGRDAEGIRDRDEDRIADRDRIQERDQDRLAERAPARDRARERDPSRARDRDRDPRPLHVQDREQLRNRDIYGSELMTRQERNQYRERIRETSEVAEWARFRAEHQRKMLERARERGIRLPPPFFGQQLMTDQEREQLRERLQEAQNEQQRERIRAEHRAQMQERAREHRIPMTDLE